MTSAEDYPDHVDDAEQLLRAVLTRHHIERIPLPDGTLRLRISRDFFLPFRSDEIGLSAFRELAGKDTIRRHADSMFSYCGFGRTQCADMREIDAEVEAAPIPKAPEHATISLSGLPAGSPAVEQDVFMRTVPLSRKGVPAAGPMIGKERG